jgi:hypothetical protein
MAINYLCEILIQRLSKPQKPTKSDIELSEPWVFTRRPTLTKASGGRFVQQYQQIKQLESSLSTSTCITAASTSTTADTIARA